MALTYTHDGAALLVDDSEDDRTLALRAFERAGYGGRLRTLPGGGAAISDLGSLIGRNAPLPAVLLLDMMMPEASGLDVLRWIREARGRTPDLWLPVVMLTGEASAERVAEAYALGCSAYVVKPRTFDRLVEVVSAICHFWLDVHL